MDTPVNLIEKHIGPVIEIDACVPMWKMPKTMQDGFETLLNTVQRHDVDCSLAPYTRYLDINWPAELERGYLPTFLQMFSRRWHFKIGLPVTSPITTPISPVTPASLYQSADNQPPTKNPPPVIEASEIPATHYVQAVHFGPYHKVGETYKTMARWAKLEDIALANESIEIYLNDPRHTEKNHLKTELLIPVI